MSGEIRHSLLDRENNWQTSYRLLKEERMQKMRTVEACPETLQLLHETVMKKAVGLAMEKIESEWGAAPAHFAFFVMGSAGRYEQAYWSDQDHGIVYNSDRPEDLEYFLRLGEEIVYALECAGYEQCDGKVMASNPRWCRSLTSWHQQIHKWLEEDTWEHLRYLLTFFDGRVLHGEPLLVKELKERLFTCLDTKESLIGRLTENTGRLRRGIGPFGQIIVETKGDHKGKFNFKQLALFPYVNGLRLLALKNKISETSTLERFERLPHMYQKVKIYQTSYQELLIRRLEWQQGVANYDHIHFLSIKELSNEEKRQLKRWVQEGRSLYKHIETLMGR